jgi:membrane fusion protein (multidrug efflux system)
MFRKPLVLFVSGAALAGLAWYGWQAQRHLSTEVAVVQKAGPAAVDQAPKKDGKTEGSAARPDGPQGKGDGPSAKGGPRGPASIEIQPAINKDLADVASAVGTLRANETVVLRSEVAGRIAYLAFKDGETVSKGHTVLKLDAAVQEAELAQAKAELALGQTNFDRSKDLAQRKFVSDSALDQAAANLRVLEAKFQLAKARLDRTVIRAPFSGQLGLRNISLGDYVKEGTDLVLLEDVASLKIDLRLPERFLGRLKKGQPIQVLIDAFPDKTFKAQVEATDIQVDANGRFVLVRGVMANPGGSLRSGMFARASLTLAERKGAVMVPEEAVTPIGNELFVWLAIDGKAKRVKVQTGLRQDGLVELIGDVRGGDQVVIAGQQRLMRDGQEVRSLGAGSQANK